MTAPVKILSAAEPWVEYQLEDGTTLRFRFTACNFRKTGKLLSSGEPEYSFTQQLACETHTTAESRCSCVRLAVMRAADRDA